MSGIDDGGARRAECYHETVTLELLKSTSLVETMEILRSLQFVEGTDTIFHYLVRRMATLEIDQSAVSWELVEMLLVYMVNHGISLDLADGNGWTALHHATTRDITYDRIVHVEPLLRYGASPAIKTPNGLTPLDLAIENDAGEHIIRMLHKVTVDTDHGVARLRRAMTRLESAVGEEKHILDSRVRITEIFSPHSEAQSDASKRLYDSMCHDSAGAFHLFDCLSTYGTLRSYNNSRIIARMTMELLLGDYHDCHGDHQSLRSHQRGFRVLCPHNQCDTVLAYSMSHSHTPEHIGLLESAIDQSKMSPLGHNNMLYMILNPCPRRSRHDVVDSYEGLVRRLRDWVRKNHHLYLDGCPICVTIGQDRYTITERAGLLKHMARADPRGLHGCICGADCFDHDERPLLELIRLGSELEGYELASALYGEELTDWHHARWEADLPDKRCLFMHDPVASLRYYESYDFRKTLAIYTGEWDEDSAADVDSEAALGADDLLRARRYILHAITEAVINICSKAILRTSDEESQSRIAAPAKSLMEALTMRQANKLPEMTVSSEVLLHPTTLAYLRSGDFSPTQHALRDAAASQLDWEDEAN